MTTQLEPNFVQYRLIITRRSASEILLSTEPSGSSLPSVCVRAARRPAEQLLRWVKTTYQIQAYCLFVSNGPLKEISSRYAVFEVTRKDDEAPSGMRWLPIEAVACGAGLTAEDQAVIRHTLRVIDGYATRPEDSPFATPGSTERLFAWVGERVKPLGVRLTGDFEQWNAGPSFSLLRLETSGGRVWFKASGEPNRHELSITMALHRLFPAYVPRILAVHPAWNAWLSEDVPGETLDRIDDSRTWAEAASTLAKLQIRSIDKVSELLESGCRDLRLESLSEQIDPFLGCMKELMAMQTKRPPEVVTPSGLCLLGDRLKTAFNELERHQIPPTLGHLDLNPGNILASSFGCRFLDWAEGCVSQPFVTFEYLGEHARRVFRGDFEATKEIVHAYTQPWQSLIPPEAIAQAMALAPLVAVFAFAAAGGRWRTPKVFENRELAGYYRSLTRRAYREAARITRWSERCLA